MKPLMRKLFLIVMILALGLMMVACGGGAGETTEPTSEPAAEEPVAEEPVAEEPVAEEPVAEEPAPVAEAGSCLDSAQGQTVEMWSPLTGPDGDEMTALAQRFSSENEYGITVNHVAQPDYIQQLNTSAAAGELPTMTVARVINVGELAERNVLKPFSAEAMSVFGDDIGSQFPEQVWSAGEYEGQRFSFPLDMHTLVMYYNKDLFAAAGLEEPGTEPMTREEFESALATLAESGVQPIAIGTNFQAETLFQTLIQQFGGGLTNEEGTEALFNSEAGVQALEYINELKQQYSPEISGTGDPEVNVFNQGNTAIVIHGPWHISNMQRLPFVGFAPFPQIGDEYAVWAGSHQLALTTEDPAQQAAAACWINWLSQNSVEWAKAGQVPARNEVRDNPELAEVAAPIATVADAAAEAIILPQVPELEGALWGQFGPAVNAVLMGEATDVQAALDQAAASSQQIIDENMERYG